MNKNILLLLLAGCTVLVAGCSMIEAIPVEEVFSSDAGSTASVADSPDETSSAYSPAAYIQIGGSGLFVNGDTLTSEEIANGITAHYTTAQGKDLRMVVQPKGADLILKHYITPESAAVLSAGLTVSEIEAYTDGRSPLYYQEIDPAQEDGFGYYFVADGRILLVHYVRGVTDHVGFIGEVEGILFFTDEELMEDSDEDGVKFLLDEDGKLTRYQPPVQSEISSASSAVSSMNSSSQAVSSSRSSAVSSAASSRAAVSSRPVTSTAPVTPSQAPVSTWTPPVQSTPPQPEDTASYYDYDEDEVNADVTIE